VPCLRLSEINIITIRILLEIHFRICHSWTYAPSGYQLLHVVTNCGKQFTIREKKLDCMLLVLLLTCLTVVHCSWLRAITPVPKVSKPVGFFLTMDYISNSNLELPGRKVDRTEMA